MDIQVSNKWIESSLVKAITNDDRKLAILNYIREHQGCSKSDVVRYMTKMELGSKKPVERIIDELAEENTIKKEKPRKNSKRYNLSTIDENPLTYVPNQLETLKNLFEKLADTLISLYIQTPEKWPGYKNYISRSVFTDPFLSLRPTIMKESSVILNALLIPFVLIDIIYAPYKYLQRTTWVNHNSDFYQSISRLLFSKVDQLNQIAVKVLRYVYKDPYKIWLLPNNNEYFLTIENKYEKFSVIEKICIMRHSSSALYLLPEIDYIFEYLIENNMKYFSAYSPNIAPPLKGELKRHDLKPLDIIHFDSCPARLYKNEYHCDSLNKDPTLLFHSMIDSSKTSGFMFSNNGFW